MLITYPHSDTSSLTTQPYTNQTIHTLTDPTKHCHNHPSDTQPLRHHSHPNQLANNKLEVIPFTQQHSLQAPCQGF